jgi:hypothetical protein
MTPSLDRGVQDLGREYPEWKPWLSVIEEVLREAADRNWEAFVPERPEPQQSKVPLLAGLTAVGAAAGNGNFIVCLARTAA